MGRTERPHLLGIDDGPFDKWSTREVVIAGVMVEGPDRVENVALTRFPVDGSDVSPFLARWIASLRFAPSVQGVVFGGITIAGLAVIDIDALADALASPVIVVNRKNPACSRLEEALDAAPLDDRAARKAIARRTPPATRLGTGIYVSCAGIPIERALAWVERCRNKSEFPEALRVAHLIAQAAASGESRGRA